MRELLRAAIGDREPATPLLEEIVRRAETHRRRERVVAAVVGLVLMAAVGVGLATMLPSHGSGAPSNGVTVVGPTREVYIPSESMTPTLRVGDTVLVDEGAYAASGGIPARGDIIVFDVPGEAGGRDFVKRVVGLPGDVVEQHPGPVLYVNGVEFPMPAGPPYGDDPRSLGPWTVAPGHVFVVGDNLVNSNDSRFGLGQVPFDRIIGKVVEILSPGDRRATVGPPPAGSDSAPGSAAPAKN
jgi:signal peptidase I